MPRRPRLNRLPAALAAAQAPPHLGDYNCPRQSVHVHVSHVPASLAPRDNGMHAVLTHVRRGHRRPKILAARAGHALNPMDSALRPEPCRLTSSSQRGGEPDGQLLLRIDGTNFPLAVPRHPRRRSVRALRLQCQSGDQSLVAAALPGLRRPTAMSTGTVSDPAIGSGTVPIGARSHRLSFIKASNSSSQQWSRKT